MQSLRILFYLFSKAVVQAFNYHFLFLVVRSFCLFVCFVFVANSFCKVFTIFFTSPGESSGSLSLRQKTLGRLCLNTLRLQSWSQCGPGFLYFAQQYKNIWQGETGRREKETAEAHFFIKIWQAVKNINHLLNSRRTYLSIFYSSLSSDHTD